MEIKIDLKNASSKEDVLQILGEVLGYDETKSWGKNWDAFNDILRYLDKGGIWGTNEVFVFPVALLISNFQTFKSQASNDFAILEDILNETKSANSEFDFKFVE
ncbi:MAG: barstar family protein [Leadbetterella sp.]|nr:barstar family protein [Leadbetterella sp.]